VLAEDEEIIGIYGTEKVSPNAFYQLGFIVWKPPKL
jgi:hypothetical protein